MPNLSANKERHKDVEVDFDVLRDAVNLARNKRASTVEALRSRLSDAGHSDEAIETVLVFWSRSLQPTSH